MHSENIATYVRLDIHKETLAVAIAAPEQLGELVIMVRLTTNPRLYVDYFRNCRNFTETFFSDLILPHSNLS